MPLRRLALISLLTLAAAGATAQKTPPDAGLVTAFGLQGYRITYRDEAGRPLSAARFNAKADQGQSMSITKDDTHMTAVLRLEAKAAAPLEPAPLAVKVGEALPPLAGTLIDGKATTVPAGNGRYTLVAFFFARCAPCLAEIPDLNRLNTSRPDLQVVGVTFDPLATTRMLTAKHGIRYATLSDAKASIDALRVPSFPTLLLIKPDGTLAAVKHGADTGGPAALNAWVTQAIAGAAAKS